MASRKPGEPSPERAPLGDHSNQRIVQPQSPSSSSQRHQYRLSASSSTMPSAQARTPFVESSPNPNLPPHFEETTVEGYDDHSDPDYLIFKTIKGTLNEILDSVRPLLEGISNYGTVGLCYADDGFDPWKNPKVLAIEIDGRSIHRWAEVDAELRKVITNAYHQKQRNVPPIRYYAGGFAPLSSHATPSMSVELHPNVGLASSQTLQQRPYMGHSIGVPGDEGLTGTMGCLLRLKDHNGDFLPGLFGLTAHHVVSNGDKPIELNSSQPVRVCAPAECDLAQRTSELRNKIAQLKQELREINSSKEKNPTETMKLWSEERAQPILGRRGTENAVREELTALEQTAGFYQTLSANKFLGKVFCSSGISRTAPMKVPGDGNEEPFIQDWALILLDVNRQGANKLPEKSAWPESMSPTFDVLKAHRQVHSATTPKFKEPVTKYGRTTGLTHGTISARRVQYKYPRVTAGLLKRPIIGFEYTVKSDQPGLVFGWKGDSGSAVDSVPGQFLGEVLCMNEPNVLQRVQKLERHRLFFTPTDVLFESIRDIPGRTVSWVAPVNVELSILPATTGGSSQGRATQTEPVAAQGPNPPPSHSGIPIRVGIPTRL